MEALPVLFVAGEDQAKPGIRQCCFYGQGLRNSTTAGANEAW